MQVNKAGIIALFAYIGTIFGSNYAITHWGTALPNGLHVVPVWFGVIAPSGTLFAGLSFTLRDAVQDKLGKSAVLFAIITGAAVSAYLSPALALASGSAFLLSELADFAVYSPLRSKGRFVSAVALSNTVGLTIDSVLFLSIAQFPLNLLPGQIIGKMWMTVAAIMVIIMWRKR